MTPEDDVQPEGKGEVKPEPDPADAPVSRREHESLQAELQRARQDNERQAQELKDILLRFAPAPTEEALPEPDENDTPAQVAEKVVKRALAPHIKRFNAVIAQGSEAIAQISERQATKDLPYYTEYKDEIDASLKKIDPSQRANPEVIKSVHDLVVGRHVGERETRIRAEEQRKAVKGAAPSAPGSRPAPAATGDIDLHSLGLSERQVAVIEQRGDAGVAQITGGRFKTVADYAKALKRMADLKGTGTNVV